MVHSLSPFSHLKVRDLKRLLHANEVNAKDKFHVDESRVENKHTCCQECVDYNGVVKENGEQWFDVTNRKCLCQVRIFGLKISILFCFTAVGVAKDFTNNLFFQIVFQGF